MQVQKNVLLGPYTTFQIGGRARYFAVAQSVDDLKEAVAFAKDKSLSLFVLGGGSNVLIADEGFDGLVIKIELGGISIEEQKNEQALLIAAAGEDWDAVVAQAIDGGLWGTENLSGIPGSVGGAIVQNIGAYGAAISEVVEWVEVFDPSSLLDGASTGAVRKMTAQECLFDYRDSIFKHTINQLIVLRVALRLSKTPKPNLSYRDLKHTFGDHLDVTLQEIRKAILVIRREKFPDLEKEGTAGSFFKNPIVPASEAEKLHARYPEMPLFAMPETPYTKIPLAWLLDHELHLNGFAHGTARLFERQPLVIAADHGATAKDVVALVVMVREKVKDAFGIDIEEEVKII